MKEIKLNITKRTKHYNNGYVAIVDDEDYEKINKYAWQLKKHGKTFYARGIVGGAGEKKSVYMHRFIKDIWDEKLEVDHKDNNGLNNIKSNLRVCLHGLNSKNRSLNRNKETSYKGVTICKGGYYARITINNKVISLGRFTTQEHAANAYNKAAIKYFGEFAFLNVLPMDFDINSVDIKNTRAKITFEIAQQIRSSNLSVKELVNKYSLDRQTIRDILSNKSWRKPLPEHLKQKI